MKSLKIINSAHEDYGQIINAQPHSQNSQLWEYWKGYYCDGFTTYINYGTIHNNEVEPAFPSTVYESHFE